MDLARLHDAVRSLARGEEVPRELAASLLPEEREALATLRCRLQRVGDRLPDVMAQGCWAMVPWARQVAP